MFYSEYSLKETQGYSPFVILVDSPGTVVLKDVDISQGVHPKEITGLSNAVAYFHFQNDTARDEQWNSEIKKMYGTDKMDKSDSGYAAFNTSGDSLAQILNAQYFEHFIKAHANDMAGVKAFQSGIAYLMDKLLTLESYEEMLHLLSPEMQQTPDVQAVSGMIAGMRNATVGNTIKNFTVAAADSNTVSFDQLLKGKYVLLDFWASWCGPCKASFPFMKQIYGKYKSDKFEIFSISIDDDRNAWLKELKNQALPWPSGWDKNGKSVAEPAFGVVGIPSTFLIDPSGKIIEEETGMDATADNPILKKLIEVFGDKGIVVGDKNKERS